MMTLADAAVYFDRTAVLDPDNDTLLFYGQLDPYDDSKRDAGAAYRRVLNVAPDTAVPAVVKIMGITWLVGHREVDGLEVAHRDKYVLQQAGDKVNIGRLTDFLAGAAASSAWSAIEWLKDSKQIEVSSDVVPMYTLYMPPAADLREHDIVWTSGAAYLAQKPRLEPSGYRMSTAFELDQPVAADATVSTSEFDPVEGRFAAGGTVASVPTLKVRWQSLYVFDTQASARFKDGDVVLIMPAAASVTTSSSITTADGATWRVVAIDAISGARCVHARPA